MKHKINYRVIIFIISLVLFQSFLYFFTKLLATNPIVLTSYFDASLPMVCDFVYFYYLWYLMLILVPYIVYFKDKNNFYDYVKSLLMAILIGNIIFVVYPTIIERQPLIVDDLSSFLVKFIYITDAPNVNCLPSMHCVMCFLFIYYVSVDKNIKLYYKLLNLIVNILIILSTLFIKQHVIWDVYAALIVVMISIILTKTLRLSFVSNIYKKVKI